MAEDETKDAQSIGDVIDGLDELAENHDEVSIGDVLDKFGSRSFAPIMLILAVIELTPIGAVPGVPTFLAACILLVAAQLLLGREHIWVPGFVERRSVSSDKLDSATNKLDGIATKLDSIAKGRLEFLARGVGIRVAGLVICVLALVVSPLEVIPWASAVPMLAIAIISLAIIVRDGLAMLIAWVLAIAAMAVGTYLLYP